MFEPVIHYLVESVRICAHVTDLSTGATVVWLLGFVALSVALAAVRARLKR